MKSLRIVLVLLEAPAPFGSAGSRWFYVLLRELVRRGHRVTCFAACSKQGEMDEARRLFAAPEYDLRLYPFPERTGLRAKLDTLRRPYSFMFSNELKRDLHDVLANGFDILHLEHIWTGWLALNHARQSLLNIHSLYRIDLAETPAAGIIGRLQRRLLLGAERRLVRTFPGLLTLSPRLRDELHTLNPAAEVTVVPLGLDPSLYPYISDEQRTVEPIVSVIGSMNWQPTYSAAIRLLTRLWPRIKEKVPNARLQLIGWCARTALKPYLDLPGVTIEENVAETRPYFERTGVLLYAPDRSTGMKVKVLEALAYGVPVVTTADGIEGLPAADGVHVGVCEDDDGLVQRTVALLSDPDSRNRQRAAGRALIESHCGPGPTVDAVERVYQGMVES